METEIKKEKPIMFSTQMVKALLAKEKTHTRRTAGLEKINAYPDDWEFTSIEKYGYYFRTKDAGDLADIRVCKPRYQKGDVLWIRENWYCSIDKQTFLGYVADGDYPHGKPYLVRSSMFLFKKFARPNRYEVVSVRPQRTNTLTDDEAFEEGMSENIASYLGLSMTDYTKDSGQYYLRIFKYYWDFLNAKNGHLFAKGEWCWDYEFREI
ncbi:MAG: hypothetical protein WC389_12890 [Lutibacter sp.]|jgi:hypothetical protein